MVFVVGQSGWGQHNKLPPGEVAGHHSNKRRAQLPRLLPASGRRRRRRTARTASGPERQIVQLLIECRKNRKNNLGAGKFTLRLKRHSNDNHDKRNYEAMRKALDTIEFTKEHQREMFSIVSSVLHVGNVEFLADDKDVIRVKNTELLDVICEVPSSDCRKISIV